MEDLIEKIKQDPDFCADLKEFRERVRFSDESGKIRKPVNIMRKFKMHRNTKALDRLTKRIADRIRTKFNPGIDQMRAIFKALFTEV